ncbi:MAG: acetate--CoA ligase family protein [Chloroflexi bacterium]|nr:acetate--CoA ligase family protein [Chloroflexota bacterium]MDA1271062.1 acetate--CoA ligase family protein [Chloroflexota bacterium]
MTTWTDDQLASIHKMLNPRSIAVVGATPRMQYGGRMLAAALKAGDRINVYPVNPRYDEIQGIKSYPSVSALPETPDVVGVVVNSKQVMDVLKESHEKGVRAAIVISAGFSERGTEEGRDLQKVVGDFAKESGLRISGPNCLGLANVKDDIWASSSSRGADGLSGPVGLVCQSGASAFGPFLNRAVDSGIGLSYIISTGNEADLDFSDFVRYLLDDDDTKVIAGFVEGFKDAGKFIEVAKLAAQRGKPIILIKIGRSELGAKAAQSHTAALTGMDALYDSALAQYGVIRVADYDELLEVANLLANSPAPAAKGLAVVSHSGGISSLTADMCGQAGLDLPVLSDTARDGINNVLKGFGWAANPSDVTGFANSDSFPEIMQFMANDPAMGILVVASSGGDAQAKQVIAQRDLAKDMPLAFLWTGSRRESAGLDMLKKARIPVFYTPNRLATGLRSLLDYHEWQGRRGKTGFPEVPAISLEQQAAATRLSAAGGVALSENQSKGLLAEWGVPTTRETLVSSADDAAQAAGEIGYPVVLKADVTGMPHKTESGLVILGLRDESAVRTAYEQLMSNVAAAKIGAGMNGVLVQEMVSDATEVIVGLSYDSQLGPAILFGTGGVMVEVYNDVALRLCPIDASDAREMIEEVKGARLLQGFRGRPPADIDALVDALVRVSQLGAQLEGSLAELDINPLMVLPAGQGVKAADAVAIFKA